VLLASAGEATSARSSAASRGFMEDPWQVRVVTVRASHVAGKL
jgi:hypothetical protein